MPEQNFVELRSQPLREDVHVTAFCQFPGTDPLEIHRVIRGELGEPNLAVLPQLADRGVGADLVGRSATMVADMGFELLPHGWRIGVPDGIDAYRARSLLRSDENLLADVAGAEQKAATRLKTTVLGPFSLSSMLYLGNGERVQSDHGARRDVREAYAHGVGQHLQRLSSITGIEDFTLQIDEPMLPNMLDGRVPTASGYRTLRSIPRSEVRTSYEEFLNTVAAVVTKITVHTAVNLPSSDTQIAERVDLLHQAGIGGWVVDPRSFGHREWEQVAALVESGSRIYLQALSPGARAPGVVEGVKTILRPWKQLGLGLKQLGQLTLMPMGSFAQNTSAQVIECLEHLTAYAAALEQTRVDA